ncbi:hypothetical protein [Ursidibacter arcticus]
MNDFVKEIMLSENLGNNKRLYRKAIKYLLLSGFDQGIIENLTTLDDSEDHKPLCGIYH